MKRDAKKVQNSRVKHFKQILTQQRFLYFFIPVVVVGVYLNTANNHFYNHLHTSGLVWPQNQAQYKIGEGTDTPISYVALGDSLTSGVGAPNFEQSYAYQTAKQISKPNQPVVLTPLSTPGFKSDDIIVNYLDKTIQLQPDIVTILIGVNDVHGLKPSSNQFSENYETIISRLHNETKASIYAIAIPSIGTDWLIWPPYRNYYNQRTKSFNNNILELTKKYGVNYIDLHTPTLKYAKSLSTYYSKDDFHPSTEGYGVWAELIANDINN